MVEMSRLQGAGIRSVQTEHLPGAPAVSESSTDARGLTRQRRNHKRLQGTPTALQNAKAYGQLKAAHSRSRRAYCNAIARRTQKKAAFLQENGLIQSIDLILYISVLNLN